MAMNIEAFTYYRDHFPYEACASYWKQHVWKRDEFVRHFSRDKIATMTVDEYVVGKGDDTTFCYGLWRGLKRLANISSAFPTAFGIYYNKKQQRYLVDRATWLDTDTAFEQMRTQILRLLDDGKKEDLASLADNPINSMVKGKILTTYYPERYLSICAMNHIDHYMKTFGLYNDSSKLLDAVYKRELLTDFKNNDPVMKDWSLDQYVYFMWGVFPKGPAK